MVSSDNEDVHIAESSAKDEVEVKRVAEFLLSILSSLAIKNVSVGKSWTFAFPAFCWQTCETKKQ